MEQDTIFFAAFDEIVREGKTLQEAFDNLVEDTCDALTIKDVLFYKGIPIKVELVTKTAITKVTASKEK